MPRFAVPLALAALAVAAPLAAEQRQDARLEHALKGLTAGTPVKCIKRHRVNGTLTYDTTLLFEGGRRFYYRNDVQGSCNGLAHGDTPVITSTHGDEYCAGDTVRTRAPTGGAFTGACLLGDFVPYSAGK